MRDLLEGYKNSGVTPTTKPKKSKVKGLTNFVLGKKKRSSSMSSSNPPPSLSSGHDDGEVDAYELEVPIDIEAAKTPEQARDAYNLLLLYYIQHQTVLHSIIAQREMVCLSFSFSTTQQDPQRQRKNDKTLTFQSSSSSSLFFVFLCCAAISKRSPEDSRDRVAADKVGMDAPDGVE